MGGADRAFFKYAVMSRFANGWKVLLILSLLFAGGHPFAVGILLPTLSRHQNFRSLPLSGPRLVSSFPMSRCCPPNAAPLAARPVGSLRAVPRGGSVVGLEVPSPESSLLFFITSSPVHMYSCLLTLISGCSAYLLLSSSPPRHSPSADRSSLPAAPTLALPPRILRSFLIPFLLLRLSDWLQGPHFSAVYISKFSSVAPSLSRLVVPLLLLTGFLSTSIFSAPTGVILDALNRRPLPPFDRPLNLPSPLSSAMYAFVLFSSLSVLSAAFLDATSVGIPLLFVGRILGGISTCIFSSASELYLSSLCVFAAGEGEKSRQHGLDPGKVLSVQNKALATAFKLDSVLAVLAGLLSHFSEARYPSLLNYLSAYLGIRIRSPKLGEGAFVAVLPFLLMGGLSVSLLWRAAAPPLKPAPVARTASGEKNLDTEDLAQDVSKRLSVGYGLQLLSSNSKLRRLALMQTCFETGMYLFVLDWSTLLARSLLKAFPAVTSKPPLGLVFSCFMGCCLCGTAVFGRLINTAAYADGEERVGVEVDGAEEMLLRKTVGGGGAALLAGGLLARATSGRPVAQLCSLTIAFFLFEFAVGVYHPCASSLRARLIPIKSRGLVSNIMAGITNFALAAAFVAQGRGVLGEIEALILAGAAMIVSAVKN